MGERTTGLRPSVGFMGSTARTSTRRPQPLTLKSPLPSHGQPPSEMPHAESCRLTYTDSSGLFSKRRLPWGWQCRWGTRQLLTPWED